MDSKSPDEGRSFFQSALFGTCCGIFAAVGYTACNACLRAVKDVDPFLVSMARAVPTVLLLGPIVLARPWSGLPMLPPPRVTALLLGVGLLAHVVGNSTFQYGLSVVGMALAVPLCLGSMIVAGATLGRVVLNEPVTPRMALGLSLLVAAIFVLSGGASEAGRSVQNVATVDVTLGVASACASGLFYALMGATLRHATQGSSTVTQSLTLVSGAGMIGLALISSLTVTPEEWESLTAHQMLMMVLAGSFNALAFIALTRALQLTSLVYVHGLNATQAAMAAVAGVVLFREAHSSYLLAGLSLTVGGLMLMQAGRNLR